MAQPTAQPTPTWIPPLGARALVMQRYLLSSSSAETLLLKWLDAEQVRWRYGHIKNDDGVPIEIALNRFWRPVGLSFSWEEGRAGRRVEPRIAASGGVAPGGVVWSSHPARPTQPQRGNNVVLSDIEFAREDIERRLAGYDEPAKPRGTTEQWVYNRMKNELPNKVNEDDYAGKIFPDRPDKNVGLKRIQNLVADIRRELELPSPHKPPKH